MSEQSGTDRRGRSVHPTQARLAWEDHETWEQVRVRKVDLALITVEDSDGTLRTYEAVDAGNAANEGMTTAFVTERWRLLAIETDLGQILPNPNPNADHGDPGSIWAPTGSIS
ncbi:MAG: hypothetical protein WEA76_01425 [Acidimicrobiia bacterium]